LATLGCTQPHRRLDLKVRHDVITSAADLLTVRANRHRGTPPAHLLMSRSTLGNFAPNPRAIRGPCSPTPQAGVAAKLCRSDLRAPGPGRPRPSGRSGAFVPSPPPGPEAVAESWEGPPGDRREAGPLTRFLKNPSGKFGEKCFPPPGKCRAGRRHKARDRNYW